MKKTNIILIFVATSLFFGSCREYRTITIAFDCNCTPQQQLAAYEVISRRIVSIGGRRKPTELIDGQFTLQYAGCDDFLARLLAQRGEVKVTEVIPRSEIEEPLQQMYEKIRQHLNYIREWPRFELIPFSFLHNVVNSDEQQITLIDSIFNSNKHLFPPNTFFARKKMFDWALREYVFQLWALNSSNSLSFNPNSVKTCRFQRDRHSRSPQILIALKEEYSNKWAALTRNNVGRPLAIVMDSKVLTAPNVFEEITGGKLVISGNFEIDEFYLMRSVILGGVLECTAKIIEIPNTN